MHLSDSTRSSITSRLVRGSGTSAAEAREDSETVAPVSGRTGVLRCRRVTDQGNQRVVSAEMTLFFIKRIVFAQKTERDDNYYEDYRFKNYY